MKVEELMERAGMQESGLALAWLKDAFHLLQSNSTEDLKTVSSKQVVINKQNIVKTLNRKLVDNDERNLEGLGELGELVTQTQTEF